MLKNHVLVALRHLRRERGYAALTVVGLAVALAVGLLIGRYVAHERSYDRFHADADRLYRVNWDFDWNGNAGVGPTTPPPLAARFAADVPEVEAATRLYAVGRTVGRHGDRVFDEERVVAADSNALDVLGFTLKQGDPAAALAMPNSVVLTETAARRYFGEADPVGQSLTLGEDQLVFGRFAYQSAFRVTGVAEDPPAASHIQFDMLTSMASHPEVAFFDWSWVWMQVATYVRMRPGASVAAAERTAKALVAAYAPPAFERIGFSFDDLIASGGRWDFRFQPIGDVYLGSAEIGNTLGPTGNRTYVTVFAAAALALLLLAVVNYVNLATARASVRAREVGVRRTLGSSRRTLVAQFLVEAVVFCALALPLGVLLAGALAGPFGAVTGVPLGLDLLRPAWLPAALVAGVVALGLAAGLYPGLYLASLRPSAAVRGTAGARGRRLRQGLVVLQFATAVALIACALGVQRQMDLFRTADLGFDGAGLVVISTEDDRLGGRAEAFRERLAAQSGIASAARTTGAPPLGGFTDFYAAEGREGEVPITSYMVDAHFLRTLGLEVVAGRAFSDERAGDVDGVLLNEAAVAALGWDTPVGRTLRYPGGNDRSYRVLGVVRDFNFASLHQPIAPFALFHDASRSYDIPDAYVVARVAPGAPGAGLEAIEAAWAAVAPDVPLDYAFLDERLGAQYRAEERLGRLLLLFAGLTVLVACLGLLGLAAFAVAQRTKEIGVRKALGASVAGLVGLLSADFAKLVGVAVLLAVPVAWYALERWLDGFAYRAEPGGGVFVLAGALALAIALVTVSVHAYRAATADPTEALRSE